MTVKEALSKELKYINSRIRRIYELQVEKDDRLYALASLGTYRQLEASYSRILKDLD